MDNRWQIIVSPTDTTVIREVHPFEGAGEFEMIQNLGAGQVFFRKKILHSLTFGGDDYKWLVNAEHYSRCETIYIQYQVQCGSAWKNEWTGRFSAGTGDIDHDLCTFRVKPDTVDEYTCILDALNKKFNALSVAPVTANASVSPSFEFGMRTQFADDPSCDRVINAELTPLGVPINGWAYATVYNAYPFTGTVYWRERIVTNCIGGSPVSPSGSGWILNEDRCAIDGTAVYVREPVVGYIFGDPVLGTCDNGIAIPPNDNCNWVEIVKCPEPSCDHLFYAGPWYLCINEYGIEYDRARKLQHVVEQGLSAIGCGAMSVHSDFFEWNPIGDANGYNSGFNYVTGKVNQVNQLLILQNSDAINPTASNPATIGDITLGELFQLFVNAFRVYWDVTPGGIRLENWKHWSFPIGIDLTLLSGTHTVIEPLKTIGNDKKVPERERLRFAHAQGRDFIGADVVYSGPCVSDSERESARDHNAGRFTTDIEFIQTDPPAISREGFTLLATSFDGSQYVAIRAQGALSGNYVTNAPLSTANLQRDFWLWDRLHPSASINGNEVEFESFMPSVKQPDILIKCYACQMKYFDPKKRVKTSLGQKHLQGAIASIDRVKIDKYGNVTLQLKYPR